ncbi:hydantoinase B/oxoprolinase family protein [Dasania marina]|uniref:hydantoinase B/oxoprolinase family protein n=1 Tax=Dasania marina TaxID=471499 RepID=UPI0030D9E57E|tara:strand:+ start:28763 stop:30442 length:1680 start_codon:yes stop_codon:yes gene_type:complete
MNKATNDIFTIEIVKNSLVAIGEEMFLALKRSSMSPIIYEALDYGIGITDATGCLIAQGNGIPGFIGTLDGAVKAILAKYENKSIDEGDVFIINDPYSGGGTHLSDVSMVKPVFYKGELIAWTANKAHWTEIGGKDPGSFSADASEIYQEGLQFPGIKVFAKGVANDAILEMIRANVRLPDMTLGDLWACSASLQVGERRLLSLIEKYSLDTVQNSITQLLDHGEAMVAEQFKKLPRGEFYADDIIDEDGLGNGPFHIQVKVTITDSNFIVDFTGTSPQVPGGINMPRGALVSSAREVFMGIADPGVPATDGCFRCIEVICPEGTLCTVQKPAPVSSYFETMVYAADVMRKALCTAMPGVLQAGEYGSVCSMVMSGKNTQGDSYLLVQPLLGGWGAGVDKDGESGQFCVGNGETRNIPVEITEARYGVRVEQYAFNDHDAGAGTGEHRGGKGVVLDYKAISGDAEISTFFGRGKTPPWGIDGGDVGSCNYAQVLRDGQVLQQFSKGSRVAVKQGDTVRLVTGTGAGWGDAKKRAPALVQEDIRNGYISAELAEKIYGKA